MNWATMPDSVMMLLLYERLGTRPRCRGQWFVSQTLECAVFGWLDVTYRIDLQVPGLAGYVQIDRDLLIV